MYLQGYKTKQITHVFAQRTHGLRLKMATVIAWDKYIAGALGGMIRIEFSSLKSTTSRLIYYLISYTIYSNLSYVNLL